MTSTSTLDALRETASRGLLLLLWLHVPFNLVVALMLANPWKAPGLLAVCLAVTATFSWYRSGSRLVTRLTIGVALICMVALLVTQLTGHPYQLDGHMYFFVALALLSAYCDWRVLLLAAISIALHHLVLNFLLPAAIYPGGASLGRVALHAVVVVLETAVLIWLTNTLATLFDRAGNAIATIEVARVNEAKAYAEQSALAARLDQEKRANANLLSAQFQATVGELVRQVMGAVRTVHDSSSSLSSTASDATFCASRVVSAAGETATNMQRVAAATEELSASIVEISLNIARAASVSKQAACKADQVNAIMARLNETSAGIDQVARLIGDVAAQTNLLALNATIEAARAGEAGKGFVVVASEVKILATRTASATAEVKAQIAAVQSQARDALSAAASIADIITELDEITTAVAASVEEQGMVTQEIASAAQSAAQATGVVSRDITNLSDLASLTGIAAVAGVAASVQLAQDYRQVDHAVDEFVVTLSAA